MKSILILLAIAILGTLTFSPAFADSYVCYPDSTFTAKVFNKVEGALTFSVDITGSKALITRNQDGKCLLGKAAKGKIEYFVTRTADRSCPLANQLLPNTAIESFYLTEHGLAIYERFGNGPHDRRLYLFDCRAPYNELDEQN
jgi:hypothetical protein